MAFGTFKRNKVTSTAKAVEAVGQYFTDEDKSRVAGKIADGIAEIIDVAFKELIVSLKERQPIVVSAKSNDQPVADSNSGLVGDVVVPEELQNQSVAAESDLANFKSKKTNKTSEV